MGAGRARGRVTMDKDCVGVGAGVSSTTEKVLIGRGLVWRVAV